MPSGLRPSVQVCPRHDLASDGCRRPRSDGGSLSGPAAPVQSRRPGDPPCHRRAAMSSRSQPTSSFANSTRNPAGAGLCFDSCFTSTRTFVPALFLQLRVCRKSPSDAKDPETECRACRVISRNGGNPGCRETASMLCGQFRLCPMLVSDKFCKAISKPYFICICHHFLFFLTSPSRASIVRTTIRDASRRPSGEFSSVKGNVCLTIHRFIYFPRQRRSTPAHSA